MPVPVEHLQADVLVIGSEAAGARAALEAAQAGLDVVVVTKGPLHRTGATLTALADFNVDSRSIVRLFGLPGSLEDSEELFFEDTVRAGQFLNDQRLVEAMVTEAPQRAWELAQWGARYTEVAQAPGHRYPRGLIIKGYRIAQVLGKQLRRFPRVRVVEYVMVLELLRAGGRVVGAVGLDFASGRYLAFSAGAVVLATGGAMALYPFRTAPDELTGDGHAMAWRAGAQLIAMEMTQFMPCVFASPPAWRGLQFVYDVAVGTREGLAGWLLNRSGERFMARYDPARMEKTTRDVLVRAIVQEVRAGRGSPSGGVYFSLAHLPKNLVDRFPEHYPFIRPGWKYELFDFSGLIEWLKQGYACEVGVGSHFFMGGVRIEPDGSTGVPGLYAAGEVAGGVHGANRLSGSAITQALVQGYRAGRAAAEWVRREGRAEVPVGAVEEAVAGAEAVRERSGEAGVGELRAALSELAWRELGPVRSGEGLERALGRLGELEEAWGRVGLRARERVCNREWVQALELRNLLVVAGAIARSAREREESRGAHYREDRPEQDPEWGRKNVVVRNEGGRMEVGTVPVPVIREVPREAKA